MKTLVADDLDDFMAGSQLRVLTNAGTLRGSLDLWAREALAKRGAIELVHPDEVASRFSPDEMACCVGGFGSMTAMYEMPPRGDEPARVVRELERFTGRRFSCVAPLNSGGFGAVLAVLGAAMLELPLLDGDGQGRIVPRIDQTTYAAGGVNAAPLAATGPWGDTVVIDSPRSRGETVGRAAVSGAGGWFISALYPAPVRELATASIPGTITENLAVGRILRAGGGHVSARIALELGGRIIARGRVLEIDSHSTGHPRSFQPTEPYTIHLERVTGHDAQILLNVHNEVVLALINGAIAGSVPDSICLLDPLRVQVVDLFELHIGDVIDILLLPAHEKWRTPEGMRLAGLEAFGFPDLHARG